ncbi:UNKNOWN [Stylonychia lemnae]|uniref:Uncharacterized protein n=1 Tax=Stylonychia lemnae TaxID=5949 RepID=A0A078B7L9_STYLE|nr:UNKNOWN [Stylonychia lemnae]|eukprot:CDW90221.1 UNKNOWN [Stylonychia lemnae]
MEQMPQLKDNQPYKVFFILLKILDFTYKNSIFKGRSPFLFDKPSKLIIQGINIEGLILKHSNAPIEAISIYNNLRFHDNKIHQNNAIQIDKSIRQVIIKDCFFSNEQLGSGGVYFGFFRTQSICLEEITFRNITYSDYIKQKGYLIRFDQLDIKKDSPNTYIKNLLLENSDFNLLLFKGYNFIDIRDSDPIEVVLQNITIQNNKITKKNDLIFFDSYHNEHKAYLKIIDSKFINNSFESNGNLIIVKQNDHNQFLIRNTVFQNNTRAQLLIAPIDAYDFQNPLVVIIEDSTFNQNNVIIDAMIRIQSNGQLIEIFAMMRIDQQFTKKIQTLFPKIYNGTNTKIGNIFDLQKGSLQIDQNSEITDHHNFIGQYQIQMTYSNLTISETVIMNSEFLSDYPVFNIDASETNINQFAYIDNKNQGDVVLNIYRSPKCTQDKTCQRSVQNSIFISNFASVQGGVLNYNKFRPYDLESNVYTSNQALYGPILSSYPFTIRIQEIKRQQIASGLIGLVELDTKRTAVIGQKQKMVVNGTVNFTGLVFIAEPGSKNVRFKVYSQDINEEKIKEVFNLSIELQINQEIIFFDFRKCQLDALFVRMDFIHLKWKLSNVWSVHLMQFVQGEQKFQLILAIGDLRTQVEISNLMKLLECMIYVMMAMEEICVIDV